MHSVEGAVVRLSSELRAHVVDNDLCALYISLYLITSSSDFAHLESSTQLSGFFKSSSILRSHYKIRVFGFNLSDWWNDSYSEGLLSITQSLSVDSAIIIRLLHPSKFALGPISSL
jgi:hypothetical protein